jgi:hypothetical protein
LRRCTRGITPFPGEVFLRLAADALNWCLGFPLDRAATDLSKANFDDGTGTVHVEGHLVLNDDPVRCIADIDLATLGGTGRLALEEKVAAAAE